MILRVDKLISIKSVTHCRVESYQFQLGNVTFWDFKLRVIVDVLILATVIQQFQKRLLFAKLKL
jgi:hypothetical protein